MPPTPMLDPAFLPPGMSYEEYMRQMMDAEPWTQNNSASMYDTITGGAGNDGLYGLPELPMTAEGASDPFIDLLTEEMFAEEESTGTATGMTNDELEAIIQKMIADGQISQSEGNYMMDQYRAGTLFGGDPGVFGGGPGVAGGTMPDLTVPGPGQSGSGGGTGGGAGDGGLYGLPEQEGMIEGETDPFYDEDTQPPDEMGVDDDDKQGVKGGGSQGGNQGSGFPDMNGLPPATFPGGPGAGGSNFPPVFPGGGLPTPQIPNLSGGGGGPPVETGGPVGDPGESADMFDRLLDSFDSANTDANEANEERYQDILEGYLAQLTGANKTLDETSEGLGEAENILSNRWNRVGSALEAGEGNLERRFQDVSGRLGAKEQGLQDILSGLGGQERKDINRRWDQQAGNLEQGLIDRGLGNTTLRSNMLSGNEERRSGDLNRLRDSLAREQVSQGNQGLNRGLGLDVLGLGQSENAIGRRSEYGLQGAQFGENTINRMLGQDQQRLTVPANLSTGALQFMERREDVGPDLGQLVSLAGNFGAFGSGDPRPRNLTNQYTLSPAQ